MGDLIQLIGSVVAILFVAWLVRRMGLGGDPRIRTEEQARALAKDSICGFDAEEIALDRAGIGALLRDSAGRVLLLRQHGSHFAARLLDGSSQARLDRNFLTITPAERTFGSITLDLGDKAGVWAAGFRRVAGDRHA